MTAEVGFNLLEDPWITVITTSGGETDLSILGLMEQAPNLVEVGGELPTQGFAITRLLLAFLHRAVDGPADRDNWAELWNAPALPLDQIREYAETVRHRFEVFNERAPFMQVPNLHTGSGVVSGLERIVADVPNNERLFTTRSAQNLRSIPTAEAARWLIHAHAFDPSGIKSGAVGDDTVKGGRGYPIGIGWSGQIGGVMPVGANLKETLLLNLVSRDADEYVRIGAPDDLPPWERDVDRADRPEREPAGAIGVYTWQSRRIRLVGDRSGVTGVVLCNGDRLTSQNRHQLDPHTSWRYSEPQTKKAKTTVYMPKLHQPGRSIWRGLAALLPAEAGRRAGQEPQPALAPGVLEWIASLNGFGVLPAGYRAQVTAIGARYENNDAIITEVIRDRLDIAVALLRQDDAALGQAACDAAADAEKVAMALWQLAENIARAAGAEPKKGAGDRARERAYAEFDRPFRTWLSGLRPGSDGLAARTEWQQQLLRLTQPVVKEIVAAASPAAWRGRPVNGRDINVPVAELWFRRALRKALPTAFETAGDVKDKELV